MSFILFIYVNVRIEKLYKTPNVLAMSISIICCDSFCHEPTQITKSTKICVQKILIIPQYYVTISYTYEVRKKLKSYCLKINDTNQDISKHTRTLDR